MYKIILVPIALDNEDDRATKAIDVAKKLADDGARITLLHVIESVPSYAISYIASDVLAETRKGIEAEMERLAAATGAEAKVIAGGMRNAPGTCCAEGDNAPVVAARVHNAVTPLLGCPAHATSATRLGWSLAWTSTIWPAVSSTANAVPWRAPSHLLKAAAQIIGRTPYACSQR